MNRHLIAAAPVVVAMALAACGAATGPEATPTATPATASVSPTAAATASATQRPSTAIVTDTPGPGAGTLTPAPSGETGIAGKATIGPTCPVERVDSPCPDRAYAGAHITVWQGGTMVAETRAGADGSFTVAVPPGTYRVVGESGATFPRGTEATITVVEGQLAQVTLRFDSGIR
jgi:hypothetical protein